MCRAACPECGAKIGLSNQEIGRVLICPCCGVDLEVLSVHPPELDWANLPKHNGRRQEPKAKWEGREPDNTKSPGSVARATCPECQTRIELESGTEEGHSIYCQCCGTDLEVICLEPAVLDWANRDWEDEDGDSGLGRDDEDEYGWADSENRKTPRSVRLA